MNEWLPPGLWLPPSLVHQVCLCSLQGLGFMYSTGIGVNSSQAKVRTYVLENTVSHLFLNEIYVLEIIKATYKEILLLQCESNNSWSVCFCVCVFTENTVVRVCFDRFPPGSSLLHIRCSGRTPFRTNDNGMM